MAIIISGLSGGRQHLPVRLEPHEWQLIKELSNQEEWNPQPGIILSIGLVDASRFLEALERRILPQADGNEPTHALIANVVDGLRGRITEGLTIEDIPDGRIV